MIVDIKLLYGPADGARMEYNTDDFQSLTEQKFFGVYYWTFACVTELGMIAIYCERDGRCKRQHKPPNFLELWYAPQLQAT